MADLADGRLQRRLAGQHAVAALASGDPVEAEPRLVVGEEPLDADLPHHAGARRSRVDALRGAPSARITACNVGRASVARGAGARGKRASENICASSDRSCRCCSVACSGTSSTNTCATGLPSGASNGIGDLQADERALRLREAPDAAVRDRDALAQPGRAQLLARQQAVDDDLSARCRDSASNSAPTASNSRAFDPASRSSRMFAAGSSRRSGSSER